jgi:hypothetical protein
MRIGKSFVEEETRRAVETELGRGYRGRIRVKWRGEKREDVRKRMQLWKARVEDAQRATSTYVSYDSLKQAMMTGGSTEEYILQHDGLLGELSEVACPRVNSRHHLFLHARPRQIYVKKQQQNS